MDNADHWTMEEGATQRRMIKRDWSRGSRYQCFDGPMNEICGIWKGMRNEQMEENRRWTKETNDCNGQSDEHCDDQRTINKEDNKNTRWDPKLIDCDFILCWYNSFLVRLWLALDYDVLSLDYDLLVYSFNSCCYSLSSELVLVQLFYVTCGHCWFL